MKTSCRQTELRNLNCRKAPYRLSKVVVVMLVLKMRSNSWIQPVSKYISLQINFSLSVVGALSTIIRYAPAPIFEYVFENLCSYLSFHGVHNDWWLVSLVIWNRFLDRLCQLLLFPSFAMTTSTSGCSLTKNILVWRKSPTSALCSMYDVDGNGWIDLLEMTKMVRSIYQVTK